MFEAVFNIVALVESNGQGLRLFKVFEQGAPVHDMEYSSLVANTYQQEVYRALRAGDTLAIAMHLDTPPRVIRRTVRFREDKQFEGEGIQKPTSDLLPMISTMYEECSQQLFPCSVVKVRYHRHEW